MKAGFCFLRCLLQRQQRHQADQAQQAQDDEITVVVTTTISAEEVSAMTYDSSRYKGGDDGGGQRNRGCPIVAGWKVVDKVVAMVAVAMAAKVEKERSAVEAADCQV